jgi:hypothetical protein
MQCCVVVTIDRDGKVFCNAPSAEGQHRYNLQADFLEKGWTVASVHPLPIATQPSGSLQSGMFLILKK